MDSNSLKEQPMEPMRTDMVIGAPGHLAWETLADLEGVSRFAPGRCPARRPGLASFALGARWVSTRREPSVPRHTCENERDSKRHNKNGSPDWPNKQCTPDSGDEEQHLDGDTDRTWRRNPRRRLVPRGIEQRGQTHENNHDERHRPPRPEGIGDRPGSSNPRNELDAEPGR
jgi:hypothetical protein